MLVDSIDRALIDVIHEECDDWQRAIQITTKYLEENGYVTSSYASAIIASTKLNGPYYVLCPGVAMPHARPEQGAIKTGIGIHVFTHPVDFQSDLGPASVLLTLSAIDSDTHIQLIQSLSEMLVDENNIDKLANATSKEDVIDIIKTY